MPGASVRLNTGTCLAWKKEFKMATKFGNAMPAWIEKDGSPGLDKFYIIENGLKKTLT